MSSHINCTLRSIIYQLDICFKLCFYGTNMSAFNTYELRHVLISQLEQVNKQYPHKKVIIYLDSIDQLRNSELEKMEWLVTKLPSNTKVIYSLLKEFSNYWERVQDLLDLKHAYEFLELKPLELESAIDIFNKWLCNSNRKLTTEQHNIVKCLFTNETHSNLNPLYTKLIFDIVKKWNSAYKPTSEFFLLKSIEDCIRYLFQMFEDKYGKFVFSRIVTYMTLMNGITENELEDIMSLDDDVLLVVFEYKVSPVQRFPMGLWARIKSDLSDYITVKKCDGSNIISWYHRKFIEVSHEVYIKPLRPAEKNEILLNVIDYYTEKWNKEEKPFVFQDMKEPDYLFVGKEVRNTRQQLIRKQLDKQTIWYNKRKLLMLPMLILELSDLNIKFKLLTEEVYFNFGFMQAKAVLNDFEFLPEANLQIAYELTLKKSRFSRDTLKDLIVMGSFYVQNSILIQQYADSLCLHIQSRLIDYYNCGRNIRTILDEIDSEFWQQDLSLTALKSYLPVINNGGLTNVYHTKKKTILFIIKSMHQPLIFIFEDMGDQSYEGSLVNIETMKTLGSLSFTSLSGLLIDVIVYSNERLITNNTKICDLNGGIVFLTQTPDKFTVISHLSFKTKKLDSTLTSIYVQDIYYLGELKVLLKSFATFQVFDLKLCAVLFDSADSIRFNREFSFFYCNSEKNLVATHQQKIEHNIVLCGVENTVFVYKLANFQNKWDMFLVDKIHFQGNLNSCIFKRNASFVEFAVASPEGIITIKCSHVNSQIRKRVYQCNDKLILLDYLDNLILFKDQFKHFIYDTGN